MTAFSIVASISLLFAHYYFGESQSVICTGVLLVIEWIKFVLKYLIKRFVLYIFDVSRVSDTVFQEYHLLYETLQ